jgi:hypothetical protein
MKRSEADAVLGGADEVAFSPDGSQLSSRGRGGEIIIWEAGE